MPPGHPSRSGWPIETGDPWILGVAAQLDAQLRQIGITVVDVPVTRACRPGRRGKQGSYDMALVTRMSSPFQTVTAAWYSDGQGYGGVEGHRRTGATSTTPRSTSCSSRLPRPSIR